MDFEFDIKTLIKEQLRIEHLNEEEIEMITNLFDYRDIFHLEGKHMTFTNELTHPIETNNVKPIFTKSYRYPQIHKE